jgi:TPR repeat protein
LNAAVEESDKYEATQAWPRAIAAYAQLQKTFPETEVGKKRLELLLGKLQSEADWLQEQSFETLRDSLTEAARLDVVSAMELLGELLRERNPKGSFDWLCAAADRGSAHAISEVGLLFSNGKSVPRDLVKAKEWFEWARQAGDVSGGTLLAECYLFGKAFRRTKQWEPTFEGGNAVFAERFSNSNRRSGLRPSNKSRTLQHSPD